MEKGVVFVTGLSWKKLFLIFLIFSTFITKNPYCFGNFMISIFFILIILDALISWTELICQNFRRKGFLTITKIGLFVIRHVQMNC